MCSDGTIACENLSNCSNFSPIRALESKDLNSNFDERSDIVENTLVSETKLPTSSSVVIYSLSMSNNITENVERSVEFRYKHKFKTNSFHVTEANA